MREISESDWKLFRQLQPLALERFCRRVLSEVNRLASAAGQSSHEQYLAVFRLIECRDKELAEAFDNPRRSSALLQLARLRAQELLTEEEFACFSAEARGAVRVFLEGWRL
jgi:hypothetical protein